MEMELGEEVEEEGAVSYKSKYRQLKSRLKYLIYVSLHTHRIGTEIGGIHTPRFPQEHECFENDVQKAQAKLLQLSRDKRYVHTDPV